MLYLEKVIKTSSASSAKGDKPFGDVGFTADDKADDKMVTSSAVKDELIDKPFNNAGLSADDKADDDADDKMCNADDNKSNVDDTFNADDKRTMKKTVIVRTQMTQYQQLSTFADDADDKNKTFSAGDAFTQFKVGDRVRYIGEEADLRYILDGEILEVIEDCEEWVKVRTSKKKPISIPQTDLELVEVA